MVPGWYPLTSQLTCMAFWKAVTADKAVSVLGPVRE